MAPPHRLRRLGAHLRPAASASDDLYTVLGVGRDADASAIKKGYRRAAMKHHPDKGGDDETFQRISRAYEVLSDEGMRAVYDAHGEEGLAAHEQQQQGGGGGGQRGGFGGFGGGGGGDPFSMFEELFGNAFGGGGGGGRQRRRQQQQQQNRDQAYDLQCGLADAYMGKKLNVTIARNEACSGCSGSGVAADSGVSSREEAAVPCASCEGNGFTVGVQRLGGFSQRVRVQCAQCDGAGFSLDEALLCGECGGAGVARQRATLAVEIPRGADEGEQIRMHGEGNYAVGAASAADVVFVLRFSKHEVFERRRSGDLLLRQQLSLAEALGGARLLLRQLDGRRLLVSTSPGDILHPDGAESLRRVAGEGMPRRDGTAADLLIKFEIAFPQPGQLTPEDQAVLRALLRQPGAAGDQMGEGGGAGGLPPVRVADGDTETESWDHLGADEYVMEPAVGEGGMAGEEEAEGAPWAKFFDAGRRGAGTR